MNRTPNFYNATAISRRETGGISRELVQVDETGKVWRANGMQSFSSGTAAYDSDWRSHKYGDLEIVRDGGKAYYCEGLRMSEKQAAKFLCHQTLNA